MLRPKKSLTKLKPKDDKLVTVYLKAVDFFQLYKNYLIGGVVVIVIVVALTSFISRRRHASELIASGRLAAARFQLSNMNMTAAVDSLERLINEHDGTPSAGIATFYLANAHFTMKKFDLAQKYYELYLADYAADPMLGSASMTGLAACYEEKQEFQKAGELYEKATGKYPQVFNISGKLMDAARCYRLGGSKDKARKIYNLILEKYSDSSYKNEAELFLAELNS